MAKSIAVETTYKDGTKAYRFVDGASKASMSWANQLARKFERKEGVRSTRTFVVSDSEKASLRRNPRGKATKRKTAKRKPSAKQLAARRKFVAAVRAGKFRKKAARKTAKRNPSKRKAPAKRKTVKRKKSAPVKRKTFGKRKFAIRATYETKSGYRYYYLRGDRWAALKKDATLYGETSGRRRMQAIKGRLEPGITQIVLVD